MKIVTKATADRILVNSLFVPVNGRTLTRMKYDGGKYKPGVSVIGRDIENPDPRIKAVYPIRRRDADGAYVQLMCVTEEGTQ